MLEHAVAGSPNSEPPDKIEVSPESETYYVPPGKPEALTGHGKAPPVKRFNRKTLALISLGGGAIIALTFAIGLKGPTAKKAPPVETATKPPTPNELVNSMPGNYSDGIPVLGEPRPGEVGRASLATSGGASPDAHAPPRPLTPLEQYEQQTALDHLRKEDAARSAGVAFANAGGNEASTAMHGGADTASGIQDRILDLAQQRAAGVAPGTSPAAYRDETDSNGQERKGEFAERSRGRDFALHAAVEAPRSPYTLFAGTILPCVMTQGINSDLPGQIGCMISQNVFDTVTGRHLLIPQGTKAIGTYDSKVAYGQSRVLVVWTRLLRPDGSTLSLEGMPGTDLSGYAGLTGHVNNHYLRLLSGVVLGSIIGATAQIATGANSQNPSFAALAAQGAGQNINEAGQQITRKNLNIQPTIEVRPGSRLNIFATKDLILPPWTE